MEEFGLASHKSDLTVMAENIRGKLNDQSPEEFLRILFLLANPPSITELVQEAENSARQFPLMHMFAPQIVDHKGRVIALPPKDDHIAGIPAEHIHTIAQNFGIRASIISGGQIIPVRTHPLCFQIRKAFNFNGIFNASPFVPRGNSFQFASAMDAFLLGDDQRCGALLIPILEESIRSAMNLKGLETTKRMSDGTQNNATISQLFSHHWEKICGVFTTEWAFEADMLFNNPIGMRIRNDWCHGLISDAEAFSHKFTYANWFILRTSIIPLLKHIEQFRL